jgi:hypothetical protein
MVPLALNTWPGGRTFQGQAWLTRVPAPRPRDEKPNFETQPAGKE